MAGKHTLKVDKGTTFNFVFVIKTGVDPWNLTGYSATMKIRKGSADGPILISLTTANGKISLDSNGKVTIGMTPAETQALIAGRHVYELDFTSGNQTITRILEGRFLVGTTVL